MKNDTTFETDPRVLMQLAKKGDTEAFSRIYDVYLTPVFRYIFLHTRNTHDAEDLAQTVFLKVYESLSRFEDRGRTPLAYFFTVARNTVIDYWRKKKEIPFGDPEEMPLYKSHRAADPAEITQRNEMAALLYDAIGELTEEQQSAVIFKFIEGFSNEEISAIMQKSEEAIRQLQCRALKSLRKRLQNHG